MAKYLMPKARNLVTGQLLASTHIEAMYIPLDQPEAAARLAELWARELEGTTGQSWIGLVEVYVTKNRFGSARLADS